MGQPIEDDGPVIRRIEGWTSESEPGARCVAGPNGGPCPSCASDPAPWHQPRWSCPRCGHVKRTPLVERGSLHMCWSCAERSEAEARWSARIRRHRPMTSVQRVIGHWLDGNPRLALPIIEEMDWETREELYRVASRDLRLWLDRDEHPSGRARA